MVVPPESPAFRPGRLCGRQPALAVEHSAQHRYAEQVNAASWSVRQRIHLGRLREERVGGEREYREVPIRSVQVESEMLNTGAAGWTGDDATFSEPKTQ